jgi:hypothetical protein
LEINAGFCVPVSPFPGSAKKETLEKFSTTSCDDDSSLDKTREYFPRQPFRPNAGERRRGQRCVAPDVIEKADECGAPADVDSAPF